MRWYPKKNGQTRIVKRFIFIPKTLGFRTNDVQEGNRKTIWLEKVEILQVYENFYWRNLEFINGAMSELANRYITRVKELENRRLTGVKKDV